MYNWQQMMNVATGYNPQQSQTENMIKGKYIDNIEDIVKLESKTPDPAIGVDFTNNKIYMKIFNENKTWVINEYLLNPDFIYDPKTIEEKLNEKIELMAKDMKELKEQLIKNNKGEIKNESNSNIQSNEKSKQPK